MNKIIIHADTNHRLSFIAFISLQYEIEAV